MTPIRVVIADPHPLFVQGLRQSMADTEDIEPVAIVGDGGEALAAIRRYVPDVALLYPTLPTVKGLDILRIVKNERLPTKVIFINTGEDVAEAVFAGALGYLLKTAGWPEIAHAIREVAKRETDDPFIPDLSLVGRLTRTMMQQVRATQRLTARQLEILLLLRNGLSQAEIASRLSIERGTVRNHVQHIYRKLGMKNARDAVAEAERQGLIKRD